MPAKRGHKADRQKQTKHYNTMRREEYQQLADLLNKAVNTAIDNLDFRIANLLYETLNKVQDTYIWPDDLSTL